MALAPIIKKQFPHITAVLVFTIVTLLYFSPVFDNQVLRTNDTTVFTGTSKEIADHRDEYHEEPLWTNSMFGGMPAYLISTYYPGNIIKYIYNIFRAPGIPIAPILLLMLGFYILLLSFRVNPWVAITGAIAYGLSSYFFIILTAGHNTKAMALGYMAPVIAGIVFAYRRDRLVGAAITSLFLTFQIIANHYQITYYTFICVLIFGTTELIQSIRSKTLVPMLKTTSMLVVAAVLALAINFASISTTLEYGKYSMRGESELSTNDDDQTAGLDRSYATHWSYGIDETLTFIIPGIKGGASKPFPRNSETARVLRQNNSAQYLNSIPQYWGNQPSTDGPVYVGAIVFFLFILGLVLIKGPQKWWLLIATILSVMLAWGKNFMFFTNLFLDYFPGYNKFRAVTMILVIAEFCMPLLGILALDKIFKSKVKKPELMKGLKIAGGITGSILLLFLIIPDLAGSFLSPNEAQFPDWLKNAIMIDRKEMLRTDVLRSLLYVIAIFLIIYFVSIKKLKTQYAIIMVGFLFIADMWPVNKRFLNNDNFVKKKDYLKVFEPTTADSFILQDSTEFRVLNLTVSPFNDGTTSYLHHSIGGYHGAKIRRYADLIENVISKELASFTNTVNSGVSYNQLQEALSGMSAINMLNTKYFIINRNSQPIINEKALGNAWFVNSYRIVENADSELEAVTSFKPENEAIIDKIFQSSLSGLSSNIDTASYIRLSSYKPNELIYIANNSVPQLAIFSEIYYPKGWHAYIGDEELEIIRANYVLRAALIPAGNNEITFRFDPDSYRIGNIVSLVGSILLILLLLTTAVILYRKKSGKNEQ